MQKIYFGSPINIFDTELEKELLRKIARWFPAWEIESPNQLHHAEGYKKAKVEYGSGMRYYFTEVLPKCAGGVFLPFRDGVFGKGVHGELEFIGKRGHPTWQITHEGIVTPITWNLVTALTVEETVARIRNPDGSTVPY